MTDITDDEAIMLAKRIKAGHPVDRERLKAQAKLTHFQQWVSLPLDVGRCVFLQGTECSIYEDRPLSCRKHFVSSPVEDCIERRDGQVFILSQVEALTSAAMNLKHGGQMARKLLERI